MKDLRSPFPSKGVISIGGAREQKLRTLPTPAINRAIELTTNYVDDGIGQILTISGPYGSGKTHLIHSAMEAVSKRASRLDSVPRQCVQLYAKTENASFVHLYKQLIHELSHELLQETNTRFLGMIALKELEKRKSENEPLLNLLSEERRKEIAEGYSQSKQQTEERLRAEPEVIFQYLDQLIIQPEPVRDARDSELQKIAGENFKKAFSYLNDTQLGKTAYKWFAMEELSDTERRRLGVSKSLTTADEAKYALRLLVTLFKHAEIRLLVYIDQVEKLLTATDPKTSQENAGQLHSLAEFFPRENALLALSGADEGWEVMRRDFWSRVGPTRIDMEQISHDQSQALIKLYLRDDETYSPFKDASEIAPFSLDAVNEILRLRGGNTRRFLQTCYEVYGKYAESEREILPEHIRAVVEEQKEFFNEKTVADEVQRLLRQKNVRFESGFSLTEGFRADFVIGDITQPSAVVEISQSVFYLDENQSALDVVHLSEDLIKAFPTVKFIVIFVGYVSSEVLEQLKRVVDHCVVYDGQGFGKAFETVIDALATQERESVPSKANQNLQQEVVEGVKSSLQELLANREEEMERLNARLEDLARQQAEERRERTTSQEQQEWREWLRNDREKWEQRQAELKRNAAEERSRLQADGENLRLRQVIGRAIPYVAMSIGVGLITYLSLLWFDLRFDDPWSGFIFNLKGLFSIIAGFLFGVLSYFLFVRRSLFPLGSLTNELTQFSGELGQLVLRARTEHLPTHWWNRCLDDPNPVIRYFGTQFFSQNTNKLIHKLVRWSDRAISETWMPLYLSYLKLATRTEEPKPLFDHLELLLEVTPDDPRIIYAISTLLQSKHAQSLSITELNARFTRPRYGKVAAHFIFEQTVEPDRFWVEEHEPIHPLFEFASAYRRFSKNRRMSDLAESFRGGGQLWNEDTETPLSLTKDELSQIIDALSPHRDGGLASFYDLPISNLYLRLYRFFAEIEWRTERGYVVLSS
jgi:Cdc6-like AAA superfamily ATPase